MISIQKSVRLTECISIFYIRCKQNLKQSFDLEYMPQISGNPWGTYMVDVYTGRRGPQPLGTVVFEEIEQKAREKLKDHPGQLQSSHETTSANSIQDAFWFAAGNAGTGKTYHSNIKAFEQWAIIPRMLVDASKRDIGVRHPVLRILKSISDCLQTTIFGVRYASPIILAPIGVQAIFAEGAEFNPALAAHALGVPFILSSTSSRSLEEVAQANGDGRRWFQLYRYGFIFISKDRQTMLELLHF